MDTTPRTEAAADSAVTRALRRVARRTSRQGPVGGPRAKTRDLRRVLLVGPPSGVGAVMSTSAVPPGLVAAAEALRAAGFDAEIYGAVPSTLGEDSMGLHIEHSFPQVVVAAAYLATEEAARDVLRTAKHVVPGIVTVLLGAQQESVAGQAGKDPVADFVLSGDAAEALPGLLARLRTGERVGQSRAGRAKESCRDPESAIPLGGSVAPGGST
jgi:hypothetical protein